MPLSPPSRNLFSNSPPVRSGSRSIFFAIATVTSSPRNPNFTPQPIVIHHAAENLSRLPILIRNPSTFLDFKISPTVLRSYESGSFPSTTTQINSKSDVFDLDSLLSFSELLCIVSSAVCSVIFTVNYAVLGEIGKRVLAWGFVGLVGGVAIGAWIRRRQWKRICRESADGEKLNLIERIEKLEEDLKSSATIVRILSRQLEKLGIRFRVTRKALKEPIAETAALAQKNSEATRALAAQEGILEKELGEIQKVLLAMQEQQQKQLELILAIAKNRKQFGSKGKRASSEQQIHSTKERSHESSNEINQIETLQSHNIDKA